jgi:uncharacterized membrane protein
MEERQMAVVSQSLDVEAPLDRVRAVWPHFVEWVLVGHDRLVCTQLACVDARQSGRVRFQALSSGGTRVVFEIDDDVLALNGEGCVAQDDQEAVAGFLRHDLQVFKTYLESEHDIGSRSARRHISQAAAEADADHRAHGNQVRPSTRA